MDAGLVKLPIQPTKGLQNLIDAYSKLLMAEIWQSSCGALVCFLKSSRGERF